MFAQGGEEAAVLGDFGSDLTEEFEEVVLDDTDDVEAVGNDFGLWEVSFDEGAVGGAQIDADDAHLVPAVQGLEEAFEVLGAFALHDIEDLVVAQVTEGGGEAAALVQSMLVDAEELGAGP